MAKPPTILIAPDGFKGTLTAAAAAQAISRGVHAALPHAELDICPIADGGEGTINALEAALGGAQVERRCRSVIGPRGEPIEASWLFLERRGLRTAVIEMAQASGILLVPTHERNPLLTTTFGTGELILAALDAGCNEIILGVGGSATCDAGCGAAQALGVRFFDHAGTQIAQPMAGARLPGIARIECSSIMRDAGVHLRIACDVRNPLHGPHGSARIFAPQKGATPEQVAELDRGLARLAALFPETDWREPGMGAAGGIAFGLCAMVGATIESGIDLILDAVRFDARLDRAALVVTGEGSLDSQTRYGKAIAGLARRAARAGVPMVIIAGRVDRSATIDAVSVISLAEEFGEDRAMHDAAACIERAAMMIAATGEYARLVRRQRDGRSLPGPPETTR